MILGTALFIATLVLWRLVMVRFGGLGFWQLAARHPDQAYDWALQQDGWHVLDPSDEEIDRLRQRDDLVGPFQLIVPKVGGQVVFFADIDRVESQQSQFVAEHGGPSEAKGQVISGIVLLYPLASIWSAGPAADTPTALGVGLSNLGYLLLVSGVISGRFGILGLHYRIQTLIAAFIAWGVGVALSNI